jgi:hypothetical protein
MIHWCPFFVESPCRYTTRGEVAWIGGRIRRALAYSKHSTVDSALQRDESTRCGVACPDITMFKQHIAYVVANTGCRETQALPRGSAIDCARQI